MRSIRHPSPLAGHAQITVRLRIHSWSSQFTLLRYVDWVTATATVRVKVPCGLPRPNVSATRIVAGRLVPRVFVWVGKPQTIFVA